MEAPQPTRRQPQGLVILSLVLWSMSFLPAHSAHATQGQPAENPDKPILSVQAGHLYAVMAVACSSDTKLLLTGGDTGAVLWDVASGREIRRFTGEGGMVAAVAFSPDHKFALTGGFDHSVRLWNVETGEEVKRFIGHKTTIVNVGYLPDPNLIFSVATEEDARIWQVSTGREVKRFSPQKDKLASFAVSRDGRLGLTGTSKGIVELLELATGKQVRVFTGGSESISAVAFSPDGRVALGADSNGTVYLWEVATGKKLWSITTGEADRIAFAPDGKSFITGKNIWSVETGQRVGHSFKGHADGTAGVAFSPDGSKAFTGGFDGCARLWDVATGAELMTFRGSSNGVLAAAFSSDGRYLVTGMTSLAAQLWDLRSGEVRLPVHSAYSGQAVAFSSDGNQYAFATGHGVLLIDIPSDSVRSFKGHTGTVRSVAFSPDGKKLLTASGDMSTEGDNSVRLWDVATSKQIKLVGEHDLEAHSVAFSPDGQTIASGGFDGQICIWNLASATLKRCVRTPGYVYSVAFSPDGTKLLTGHTQEMYFLRVMEHGLGMSGVVDSATAQKHSKENVARLWDVATLKEIRQFDGHSSLVHAAAFSPDGRLVVLGTGNFLGLGYNTARLFEVATGKEIQQLKGHGFDVIAAAFTPDGRFVMTASVDGTRFWDPGIGKEICRLILTADGTRIVLDPQRSFFDTNQLEAINGLQWLMSDDPLRPLPMEIFMRDYYEPRLLPRLLAGDKFKPVRSLTELNRVQPLIQIKKIEPQPDMSDTVAVTVEVSRAEGKFRQAGKEISRETGVYELRVFRDGQLVGYDPQTSADLTRTAPELSAEQELSEWRRANEVKLDATGKMDKTFFVRLPHTPSLKEIVFSAYAFNDDRVKSVTDSRRYELPKEATAPPIKGRAYLITVGVNVYESPEIRSLLYPANDARSIRETVSQALRTNYDEVVAVPLIAESLVRRTGEEIVQPTKDNLKLVLELLAGKEVKAERLKNIPQAIRDKIRVAGPDDLILIFFATHGEADDRGNFYLYPFDTGPTGSGQSLFAHCISSEELSLWLRDVDAGDMVMILDACHSGAAPGAEFKPGPMGSRGLGQLAYDKGMRVLAATQADNVALGSGESLGGLLTTALIRDGLQKGEAANGGKISMKSWLEYGVKRVPLLYEEEIPKDQQRKVQQPALFDFAKKSDRVVLALER